MKLCLLNECEACGRRWGANMLRSGDGPLISMLVEGLSLAPPGCPGCNEPAWTIGGRSFCGVVGSREAVEQRMRGEGWIFIDGRARMRDDIPPQ